MEKPQGLAVCLKTSAATKDHKVPKEGMSFEGFFFVTFRGKKSC
jgi:hypothetical protein